MFDKIKQFEKERDAMQERIFTKYSSVNLNDKSKNGLEQNIERVNKLLEEQMNNHEAEKEKEKQNGSFA